MEHQAPRGRQKGIRGEMIGLLRRPVVLGMAPGLHHLGPLVRNGRIHPGQFGMDGVNELAEDDVELGSVKAKR